MDKLENLKDLWQNQPQTGRSYTKEDIYSMVRKRSSSIVKWILIISIIEFLLPYVLILMTDLETPSRIYAEYGLTNLTNYYEDWINGSIYSIEYMFGYFFEGL